MDDELESATAARLACLSMAMQSFEGWVTEPTTRQIVDRAGAFADFVLEGKLPDMKPEDAALAGLSRKQGH